MDQKIKRDWIAELRSGKYKQGTGVLHNIDEGSYCCLGVLCKMAFESGVVIMELREAYEGTAVAAYGEFHGVDTATAVLPKAVQKWAGIVEENPVIYGVYEGELGDGTSLGYMNDHGVTFEEIADIIEGNL